MIRTFYEPVKILGFASNIGRRGVSLSLYRHTSERNGELRGHGRLKMKWEVEDGVEEEVGGGELFYGSTLIQSKSNMGGTCKNGSTVEKTSIMVLMLRIFFQKWSKRQKIKQTPPPPPPPYLLVLLPVILSLPLLLRLPPLASTTGIFQLDCIIPACSQHISSLHRSGRLFLDLQSSGVFLNSPYRRRLPIEGVTASIMKFRSLVISPLLTQF
ncbi:hypothetical protein L1887_04590 [Cichorium endivia]|nr:hypothetical protein L1887_04590 [Cichorium endivia]